MHGLWRSRWAAFGAAVAVSFGGGGLWVASASSAPTPSAVVSIEPARILDTRTDVGLAGPFVSPVSQKLQVTGSVPTTNGASTVVPAGATGVLLNVTSVRSTANGFVSIRPGDATGAPSTSSLNFLAGQTVPNSVQVGLPTSGANAGMIDITYDALGIPGPTTELLVDVVGYLVEGAPGPTGPQGPQGAQGPIGPRGFSAWDTIPPGVTVTGVWGHTMYVPGAELVNVSIPLPARAPLDLADETVNFAPDSSDRTGDDDATCTGTPKAPTAPPGKVCLYLDYGMPEFPSVGLDDIAVGSLEGFFNGGLDDTGFYLSWFQDTDATVTLYISWAYTAPAA
jgi:hypothetical protein